jgi:multiple sugar transport system ATP-binding protein
MSVRLIGVSKQFAGAAQPAVDGIRLEIETGEFFTLLGPSGCGKTTLLRMIAGLETPSGGEILIDGEPVNAVRAGDRGVSMVFQNYALYPHMNGFKNMAFGLRVRQQLPSREIAQRVHEMAELLGVEHVLKRKPGQMSGGEQQRVALGRALIKKPKVFLLDEPLSNLDLKMREQMRIELKKLHRSLGVTTIFVTHDQSEAMSLSDRIAVMRRGAVEQVGPPQQFYDSPVNVFVSRFIGSPSVNLFTMTYDPVTRRLECGEGEGALRIEDAHVADQPGTYVIGIRPQHLDVVRPHTLPILGVVEVDFVEHLGDHNEIVCKVAPSLEKALHGDRIVAISDPELAVRGGEKVGLRIRRKRFSVFAEDTGEALGAGSPRGADGDLPGGADAPAVESRAS